MRRPHRIIGGTLVIVGWFCFKDVGDLMWKDYGSLFESNAISAYITAAIFILAGIRLFTGIPFFRFNDFRKQEKPNATG